MGPEKAAAIVAACTGRPGDVTEESKPSTQLSPLLFDLTSLQREGNSKFGFSAKTTLSIAQALYERHKVLTYPRTDARALPEDYLGVVGKTMQELGAQAPYKTFAKQVLKNGWVRPNKRIFDNTKISDHFAIIPTLQTPGHLSEVEAKLYDLVVKRFLAVFFPAAEYLVTTRITRVEGHAFKTEGKVLVEARLARDLRPRGDRGAGRAGQGRRRREGPHRRDRVGGARHATAGALHRSHAADRDGRRRQADRGRRTARGDGGQGPRHSGHPRADHREPDRSALHGARWQGPASDRARRST